MDKISPDSLRKLGLQGLSDLNNKEATVMTVYDGGDGVLYQCADVKLQAASGSPSPSSAIKLATLYAAKVALVAAVAVVANFASA